MMARIASTINRNRLRLLIAGLPHHKLSMLDCNPLCNKCKDKTRLVLYESA
jgi:hypothetical protein